MTEKPKMKYQKTSPETKLNIISEWKNKAEAKTLITKYNISKSGLWNIVHGIKRKTVIRPKSPVKKMVLGASPVLKVSGKEKERIGRVNIYRGNDGYYYGDAPYSHKDKRVETGISADYAFEVVGRWNRE